MEVSHTCLWVSDLEATKAFYIDAMGLHHTWDFVGGDGTTSYYVAGDGGVEIQFKYNEEVGGTTPGGIDHLAIVIDNVDEKFKDMVDKTGCKVVRSVFQNDTIKTRVAFIEDPDGYVVELLQHLD